MKMLLFDFKDSEKNFFDTREFPDIKIDFFKEPLNERTILDEINYKETDCICVFTTSNLTENVLSKFSNLRIIATRSTSYSHIDINYCAMHNIAVVNVEPYGNIAVAEFSIALVLNLLRNIIPAAMDFKNHIINYNKYEGRILSNMTIGIIGCGAIGSTVTKIAHFLGMKVLVSSFSKNKEIADLCEFTELDNLLSESDIISLHLPYTGDNYHFIGIDEFKKMKDGVYIVNTSRGELIDITALYENLESGKVKGAALDVLECEYLSLHPEELVNNVKETSTHCVRSALITQKLLSLDNVIITPHIAYNTKESVNYILETTFNNILDYNKGFNSNRVC